MTKSEFLEKEKVVGFDWAVHELNAGLNSLKLREDGGKFIIELDEIYDELNKLINENNFLSAIDILHELDYDYVENNKKTQTRYWVYDDMLPRFIKPIKSIKDIEDFFEKE